jgi:hypothetical protein
MVNRFGALPPETPMPTFDSRDEVVRYAESRARLVELDLFDPRLSAEARAGRRWPSRRTSWRHSSVSTSLSASSSRQAHPMRALDPRLERVEELAARERVRALRWCSSGMAD